MGIRLTIILCGALLSVAALADSDTPHQKFYADLQSDVLAQLVGKHWVSDCYQAENGLGARSELSIDASGEAGMRVSYFFDRQCGRAAAMDSVQTTTVGAGERINSFRLSGAFQGVLVREEHALRLESGATALSLYEKGE